MDCNHTDVTKTEFFCMVDIGVSANFQFWWKKNSHHLVAILIAQHVCHGCVQDI